MNKIFYIFISTILIFSACNKNTVQSSNLESIERSILANHILVFTWDGEPVVEYETDVDLKNFCVSDSDDILYAIAYTPDPQLVSFVLE